MLQLTNVTLKRSGRTIFDQANLTIFPGHKAGIVGRNGAGKTTLFELIRGRLLPEEGEVTYPKDTRTAWLRQDTAPSPRSALDFVIDGDQAVRTIERQIAEAEASEDHDALADAYMRYEDVDGYEAEARAGTILGGLGFVAGDFDKPHEAFSGGWRIRLNLAKTLMTPSDLLLLDEPTNHLDLETTLWLENWVRHYQGTLLMIAHDRDFLDKTVREIVHIDGGRIEAYSGNYASFERQRAETLARQAALHKKQQLEIAHIERFINRFRAKESKAKQAQSRIKALERMQLVAPVHAESPYRFQFTNPSKTSNPTISYDHVALGYDGKPVLEDVTLRVYPSDRIGVLGMNGAGKTTLLRGLANNLEPLGGEANRGRHASVGYFAQHQLESLKLDETPLAHVTKPHDMSEQQGRNYLGGWGFGGDDVTRDAATLSGGEKARLVLALIALTKPAVLILDEPTNHLDLEMRQALSLALQDYVGALLLVSHDRHLLRQCVDEFWLIANGRVERFPNDLDAYAALATEQTGSGKKPGKKPNKKPGKQAGRTSNAQDLAKQQAVLEKKIERMTHRLEAVDEELAARAANASADGADDYRNLAREQKSLRGDIAEAEREWLTLQERLDDFIN